VIEALPLAAAKLPGEEGVVAGVATAVVDDALEPRAFTARTAKVYAVPLVRPATVKVVPVPPVVVQAPDVGAVI